MKAPLGFGNHSSERWCSHGMHYVSKHQGKYIPTTKNRQEWCCNGCIQRMDYVKQKVQGLEVGKL